MASSSSSSSTPVKRLLKCFCGCSELTADEVKIIYRLKTFELLNHSKANILFKKYLETTRSGDMGDTEQALEIYNKCAEFQEKTNVCEDDLEELSECGLQYALEKSLKAKIRSENKSSIEAELNRIKEIYTNQIELSDDFRSFKTALKRKLKQVKDHKHHR